jgi:hypothetical protein
MVGSVEKEVGGMTRINLESLHILVWFDFVFKTAFGSISGQSLASFWNLLAELVGHHLARFGIQICLSLEVRFWVTLDHISLSLESTAWLHL